MSDDEEASYADDSENTSTTGSSDEDAEFVEDVTLNNVSANLFSEWPRHATKFSSRPHWPLHVRKVQGHYVGHFDAIVAEFAPEMLQVYLHLTAPYRSVDGSVRAFGHDRAPRPIPFSALALAKVSIADIDILINAGYIEECDCIEIFESVILFAVDEEAKKRRRLITWPLVLNAADDDDTQVVLPGLQDITLGILPTCEKVFERDAAVVASCYDITSWFPHFKMQKTVRAWYGFRHGNKCFRMVVIPTGARRPPKFAQIVSVALGRAAAARALHSLRSSRFSHSQQLVLSYHLDVYIDNTRIIGSPRFLRAFDSYVWVGNSKKTTDKLVSFTRRYPEVSPRPVQRQELQSVLGLLLWAARVAGDELPQYYFILRWARRFLSCSGLPILPHSDIYTWIRNTIMCGHCLLRSMSGSKQVVVATDASNAGWSAIFFAPHFSRLNISVLAGPWLSLAGEASINVRELRALRFGIERWRRPMSLLSIDISLTWLGDNTSSLAWVAKGNAPCLDGCRELLHFFEACRTTNLRVTSSYFVPSELNVADAPSRWGYWSTASWFLETSASAAEIALVLRDEVPPPRSP